ncbi:hypothetical protein SAMN06269301_2138 [Geobacter sp. DSM 9736]|nr:hypothetical protein SAMN06269301_2138 [Geobacter sp. DSM 9736]
MLIVVQYLDEMYDAVIHDELDGLIGAGKLLGFSSPHGWVNITRTQSREGLKSSAGKSTFGACEVTATPSGGSEAPPRY